MKAYKLDRTYFNAGNHGEASNNFLFWQSKSLEERLSAANYLNSVAYNFPFQSPPKMDRGAFATRKREE